MRCAIVLVLLVAPTLAGAQSAKQRQRVVLGPEEVALGLVPLDPDRYVRVDNTPWEKGTKSPRKVLLRVVDVKAGEHRVVELPIGDFEAKFKDNFYDEAPFVDKTGGWRIGDFDLEPVQYDGKQAHAILRQHRYGASVKDGYAKQHFLLARWDLEQGVVDRVTVLAEGKAARAGSIGPSRDGKGLWVWIDVVDGGKRTIKVHRVDLGTDALDEGRPVELPVRERRIDVQTAASRGHEKVALVEYSEAADGVMTPPAQGFILDTASGKVATFDAPWTPYGLAFDAAAKRLAVGSNQAGTLALLDASSGKELKKVKGAKSVQALAFSKKEQWIYVIASSLQGKSLDAYAVPSLKKKALPAGKIVPGSQCFDGENSHFAPDGSWLLTWATAPKNGLCWRTLKAVDLIDLN